MPEFDRDDGHRQANRNRHPGNDVPEGRPDVDRGKDPQWHLFPTHKSAKLVWLKLYDVKITDHLVVESFAPGCAAIAFTREMKICSGLQR